MESFLGSGDEATEREFVRLTNTKSKRYLLQWMATWRSTEVGQGPEGKGTVDKNLSVVKVGRNRDP